MDSRNVEVERPNGAIALVQARVIDGGGHQDGFGRLDLDGVTATLQGCHRGHPRRRRGRRAQQGERRARAGAGGEVGGAGRADRRRRPASGGPQLTAYTEGENAPDEVVRSGATLHLETLFAQDGWTLYKL